MRRMIFKNEFKTSTAEEIANVLTHGIGTAFGIAALSILVVKAALYGNVWHVVSMSIYGATLVILYMSSTLYHMYAFTRARQFFKMMDHISIYLLIAGTYTPFTLISLRGGWGWTIFGIVWGIAVAGIVMKVFYTGRFEFLSTLLYLGMGWIIIIAVKPLIEKVETMGLIWLLIGGLSYSLGTIFFRMHKMRYHHFIWHLFVLGGSVSHFFAILYYVNAG